MQFSFDCEKALSIQQSSDKIAILKSTSYAKLTHPMHSSSMSFYQKNVVEILDKMGEASSRVDIYYLISYLIGLRTWWDHYNCSKVLYK